MKNAYVYTYSHITAQYTTVVGATHAKLNFTHSLSLSLSLSLST